MQVTWLGDPEDANRLETELYGLQFFKGKPTNVSDKIDPKVIAKLQGNRFFKVSGGAEPTRGPAETDEAFNARLAAWQFNQSAAAGILSPPPGAAPVRYPDESEADFTARTKVWQAQVDAFKAEDSERKAATPPAAP